MWSLEILRYHFRASNRHQTLADLLVIEVISRANIGIQPRGQQVLHTEPEASECPNNTNYSMSCGWLMMVGLIGLGNWTSRKFHRSPALNVWRRVIPETRETMGDHGRPLCQMDPNGLCSTSNSSTHLLLEPVLDTSSGAGCCRELTSRTRTIICSSCFYRILHCHVSFATGS